MKTETSLLALALAALAAPAVAQDTATTINFGDSIAIAGTGVSVEGSAVTISAAGTYVLSGTLQEGSVTVDAPGAGVMLVLDNARIHNPEGPAILVLDAETARVTLAEGSANSLSDGGESDFDAALYSRPSLTLDGSGALEVDAAYEGVSSEMHITFEEGTYHIRAVDDGINANNDNVSIITIAGGYLHVVASEGDGIDSNGSIDITGGTVISLGSILDMNSGLDADLGVTIDGGTVIASVQGGGFPGMPGGAPPEGWTPPEGMGPPAGMELPEGFEPGQMPPGGMPGAAAFTGNQGWVSVTFDETLAAGTLVALDDGGVPLLAFAPGVDVNGLAFSFAGLSAGAEYGVALGGDAADGLFLPASGTALTPVTAR